MNKSTKLVNSPPSPSAAVTTSATVTGVNTSPSTTASNTTVTSSMGSVSNSKAIKEITEFTSDTNKVLKEFNYIEKKSDIYYSTSNFKSALINRLKNRYGDVIPNDEHRVILINKQSIELDLSPPPVTNNNNNQDISQRDVLETSGNYDNIPLDSQGNNININNNNNNGGDDDELYDDDDDDEYGGDDYINASYIDDSKFICTQGPMKNTLNDFWRMVWQEKSNVIVMLTKEVEKSIPKCDRYWIETGSNDYGEYRLTALSTLKSCTDIIQRTFILEHIESGEKREISHFQYISWPDHNTPSSVRGILNLIERVKAITSSGPIVVHCSAGIGRSGTFCIIYTILNQIQLQIQSYFQPITTSSSSSSLPTPPSSQSTTSTTTNTISSTLTTGSSSTTLTSTIPPPELVIDIPSLILKYRSQRPGLVQTLEQFRFCYLAIAERLSELQYTLNIKINHKL